jgi:predicted lipoprotein with Yx(FWY)xxD motif
MSYGACAQVWPPLFAKGRPRGRPQVTYRGQPLYFYVHDPKGRVLCNGVFEFGGTWFALNAEGRPPS